MKKILLAAILALNTGVASAQVVSSDGDTRDVDAYMNLGDITVVDDLIVTDDVTVGGDITLSAGDIIFSASGKNVIMAAYVPTLAATPVAGTNQYLPGLNIIPTNAANNAGFLGAATPVVGQQFRIVNASGAAQRIKASGGATLNGATAGGYISIASLATVDCTTATAANQVCTQAVIPTPAGP